MTIYKALLGTALLAVIATPSFAADGKKTKEIKEIVGYNFTETQTYEGKQAALFKKIDYNSDGIVSLKEYQNASNADNEYELFTRIDRDGSKGISMEEFVSVNVTKGNTNIESELFGKVSGTNLRTRKLPAAKTYYVPVEPEIVEIKQIEPAAE